MSNSAITGPIFTDVRRSPSGSAAAPSWSFADSTGTGVYLVSAGVLGLSTNGVQRVVVDAAGNVGIGTASPEYKIDVTAVDNVTTTTAFAVQNSARNYGLGLGAYTLTNRNIGGNATNIDYTFDIGGATIFKTADTERMRISSSGVSTFYGYARIESPAQSASNAGNETINCALKHIAKKTGGDAEITLLNLAEGQTFTLVVTSTGSFYTLTWSPTIKWPSGVIPTPTANSNSRDVYTFTKIGGEIFGTVAKDMR